MSKKYYWLKLQHDFFERDEIKVIEAMDNGKDYIIFYMKLLLKSIKTEGELRFSKAIPYNEKMLATITNTNIDIVRAALTMFIELHLIERWSDKTLYMKETQNMIGSETDAAARMRRYRERKALAENKEKRNIVTPELLDVTKSYTEIDIEKEKDIEIEKEEDIYIETEIETSEEKESEEIKEIFQAWITADIIKHKRLTRAMETKIKSALKDYTVEEIKQAIRNYGYIVNDDRYFFNYKWTLDQFCTITQKDRIGNFLDLEVAKNNYRANKGDIGNGGNERHNIKNEDDSRKEYEEFEAEYFEKWKI